VKIITRSHKSIEVVGVGFYRVDIYRYISI